MGVGLASPEQDAQFAPLLAAIEALRAAVEKLTLTMDGKPKDELPGPSAPDIIEKAENQRVMRDILTEVQNISAIMQGEQSNG